MRRSRNRAVRKEVTLSLLDLINYVSIEEVETYHRSTLSPDVEQVIKDATESSGLCVISPGMTVNGMYYIYKGRLNFPLHSNAARFKRTVIEETVREILILKHPEVNESSNVINLEGIFWKLLENEVHPEYDQVYVPCLLYEHTEYGTLSQAMDAQEYDLQTKEYFCADVTEGLRALHVSGVAHCKLPLKSLANAIVLITQRRHQA